MNLLDIIEKNLANTNLSLNEFFFLCSSYYPLTEEQIKDLKIKWKIPLNSRDFTIYKEPYAKFKEVLDKKLFESSYKETLSLANTLKEIFPKGKKEGTSLYWTEGTTLIDKRLRAFFKKYGEYSKEDIIEATKRYVESFHGDYSYMRTLKYFIFKDVKGAEEVENSSDLLTWIENKNDKEPTIIDVEIC